MSAPDANRLTPIDARRMSTADLDAGLIRAGDEFYESLRAGAEGIPASAIIGRRLTTEDLATRGEDDRSVKVTKEHILPELQAGVRVRLNGSHQRRAWTVTARTDEHIILIRQAPFHAKGMHEYTIIEERDYRYNGVRPGLVRSSLNTLGGGWDIDGRIEEGTREMIEALESGEFELSNRRVFPVNELEIAA